MAEIPDQIVLKRHRDLEGRRSHIHYRRAAVGLLAAFLIAGLFNVFGQKPSDTLVTANGVSLDFHAPSSLRGGLLYEVSFTIRTDRPLKEPTLVLSGGWALVNTINSLEPSPATESSRQGDISLGLGPIGAGDTYTLYGEFQVNPTSVGSYPGYVVLYDGDTRILHIDHDFTVYP